VGNFTYIDNISHPVFVYETSDNNWVIGNSSIFYVDIDVNKEATRNVPDIIEIDPSDVSNTDNKLISSVIKFSDYSLGGIYESDGRFIITGLTDANTSLSSITGDDLRSEYDPVPESIEFRASAMDDLKEYAGTVIIIDKTNNRTQVLYTSPDNLFASSIDRNDSGDLVISESSFSDSSGRIITLNSYGNITSNYGSGSFGVINSVNALNNNKLIISV
jgi:hypothetical protein